MERNNKKVQAHNVVDTEVLSPCTSKEPSRKLLRASQVVKETITKLSLNSIDVETAVSESPDKDAHSRIGIIERNECGSSAEEIKERRRRLHPTAQEGREISNSSWNSKDKTKK